ncbi:hypothetical protein KW794_03245 [Candidatus Saccharibacteria bacterium]|nr:hypothetical protein [Candidatus Saccharibacteria bacterium]
MPNDKTKDQKPASQAAPANTEESLEEESLEPTDGTEQTPSQPATPEAETPPPKPKGIKGFPLFNNLYLVIFGLVVLVGAAVIFISVKSAKPQTTTTKASSLTDQQISSLKGNTTLVGDAKQTLDIQSNSIFEGQILARADLNVAGSLKVGGPLSIPSISVGGNGSFGQVGVSGPLNVAGDTTMQGALAVQKNLTVAGSASFGSLNVSSLSVTTLQLKGDISLNQHIITSGGAPGRSNGTALGSGGSASVGGSDTAGTISINTGGSPPAGCFITVNFAKGFGTTPHVVISASNSSAASLQYYTNRSPSNFSVCTANVPAAGTTYVFDYVVIN